MVTYTGTSGPGRVVDILEACGAFDLGSSPSRDVIFSSEKLYSSDREPKKFKNLFIQLFPNHSRLKAVIH